MTAILDTLPVRLNKDDVEVSLCQDSFEHFVKRFWSEIIAEELIWGWHLSYLCKEVQTLAERVLAGKTKEYDLIINVSPGTTKSTICTVMLPVWLWTRNPTLRSICGSYAFPLSLNLATLSRNLLWSKKFRRLFPEAAELTEYQKGLLINAKGGQRITTSTGGGITGMHGHILIIDDPINPREAASMAMVQAANDWIDHTLMTRKVDKKVTPTLLIMQRLHQNDPTGHMLSTRRRDRVRWICLPATTPDGKVRPRRLRSQYVDGHMDPIRLGEDVLTQAKVELGEVEYAGQFLQSPAPPGGATFKIEKLVVEESHPKMARIVRYWDKAATAGGGAFTVGVKMGVDKRDPSGYWILDVIRGQWEAGAREGIIHSTAVMDGREVMVGVEQEPGSGGKESAQATVRRLVGFSVRTDRPVGDKELRADPFAIQVNDGRVRMVKGEWNKAFREELQFFPRATYKDQVDASSGAFALLIRFRRPLGALR